MLETQPCASSEILGVYSVLPHFKALTYWVVGIKRHFVRFNSSSGVFLCNSTLLTNIFLPPPLPVRVEMAITTDGSLVFAVIFLTGSRIDFVKPLINLRQELDRSVVTAKLPWIVQWFLLQFCWPGEVYLEKRASQRSAVRCFNHICR